MRNFTRYSALFLLLLFARVMTPNELLLQLHAHEHTEEIALDESQTHVGVKHTHCETDNLFHAPFQPAEAVSLPAPLTFETPFGAAAPQSGYITSTSQQHLRGPPAAQLS
ncbi:hypothetical protein [Rufibacter roseus]|uniref:DUF2946 domain-containing protein n=1 Tax=Rufibacter roseus TaxID=1567108 RepID=A0ABW2DI93_9BACT|nr:hypothetical protein [Rufibacter roseus]